MSTTLHREKFVFIKMRLGVAALKDIQKKFTCFTPTESSPTTGPRKDSLLEVNYVGNMKTLWQELDTDGSGFITMGELDQEATLLTLLICNLARLIQPVYSPRP